MREVQGLATQQWAMKIAEDQVKRGRYFVMEEKESPSQEERIMYQNFTKISEVRITSGLVVLCDRW